MLGSNKTRWFMLGADDILRFRGGVCVPKDLELEMFILEEGFKLSWCGLL